MSEIKQSNSFDFQAEKTQQDVNIINSPDVTLSGSNITKTNLVNAQAITDTVMHSTSPILMNGEDIELEITNTLDQNISFYIQNNGKFVLQASTLSSEKLIAQHSKSTFINKFDGSDSRLLRLKYTGNIVVSYQASTTPTTGSLTVDIIKKVSV